MANAWSAFIFETTTGNVVAEVPFTGVTASWGLNDLGAGSVTLPLGGSDGVSKENIEQWSQPWRWSVAVCWNRYILQAGPVLGEAYSEGSTTTLNFGGIWKVFAKRVLLPVFWPSGIVTDSAADTTYTNLTLRQIAKNIVQTNLGRYGSSLPIDFPPDDPAGTNTRTYYGYDLNIVADMLTNLTAVLNGPEIEFRPYFNTPNNIRYTMRIGAPRLGQIGSPWVWDYGSRGALMGLDFSRSGDDMTFSHYVRGAGDKYTQIIGHFQDLTLINAGYPNMETVNGDHTDAVDMATVNAYAQAWVPTYQNPLNTFAATVKMDGLDLSGAPTGSPTLDMIQPGDTGQFAVSRHHRLPDGAYTYRITGIETNDAQSVKLTLQPTHGYS